MSDHSKLSSQQRAKSMIASSTLLTILGFGGLLVGGAYSARKAIDNQVRAPITGLVSWDALQAHQEQYEKVVFVATAKNDRGNDQLIVQDTNYSQYADSKLRRSLIVLEDQTDGSVLVKTVNAKPESYMNFGDVGYVYGLAHDGQVDQLDVIQRSLSDIKIEGEEIILSSNDARPSSEAPVVRGDGALSVQAGSKLVLFGVNNEVLVATNGFAFPVGMKELRKKSFMVLSNTDGKDKDRYYVLEDGKGSYHCIVTREYIVKDDAGDKSNWHMKCYSSTSSNPYVALNIALGARGSAEATYLCEPGGQANGAVKRQDLSIADIKARAGDVAPSRLAQNGPANSPAPTP